MKKMKEEDEEEVREEESKKGGKRIEALETEVKVVKGEIKQLLIDIREMMNNFENPFYNVATPEDLAKIAEIRKAWGEVGEGKIPYIEEIKRQIELEKLQQVGIPEAEAAPPGEEGEGGVYRAEERPPVEGIISTMVREPEVEAEPVPVLPVPETEEEKLARAMSALMPEEGAYTIAPVKGLQRSALTELMKWVDSTLGTIGRPKMQDILDLYGMTGGISDDMKNFIVKIADLAPSKGEEGEEKVVPISECITALSQLFPIIHIRERSEGEGKKGEAA